MTIYSGKSTMTELSQERGDIKIWSEECRNSSYTNSGDQYLCTSRGIIPALNHEVRHETFPYVSGNYENLS
jgi:hypothetical protein